MRPIADAYGTSWVHRLPASLKLGVIFALSILLFSINRLDLGLFFFVAVIALYPAAGFSLIKPLEQMRALWWLLAALFFLQLLSVSWQASLVAVVRLATLILLAALVSATTPVSRMMVVLERFFAFLKPVGINPEKIALTLSLTLRFIPVLAEITQDVREAQRARGLDGNIIGLTVPIIIRTLKMSEDVAMAIEARCYSSEKEKKP